MNTDEEPACGGSACGFDRSVLQAANVLESRSSKPSELTNPIHPIFRRHNFLGASRQVYRKLYPALRLASLFITKEECLEWWCTVMLGEETTDPSTQRQVLKPVTPTPSSLRETRQALEDHAVSVRFTFSPGPILEADYGYTTDFEDTYCGEDILLDGDDWLLETDAVTLIRLRQSFLIFAMEEYSSSTLSQQLRFQFFLAILLVHEIAHSVYWLRSGPEEPHYAIDEPCAELGASWERFMLGCKVQPINFNVGAESGLLAYRFETHEEEVAGRLFYALPMDYISSFFSNKKWELVEEIGIGHFRAPIYGALKSCCPVTTDYHSDDFYSESERLID